MLTLTPKRCFVFSGPITGVQFYILASAVNKDHPADYYFGQSIRGKILQELDEFEFEDDTDEKQEKMDRLHHELFRPAEEASFPPMRELGPAVPLPEPQTMQELLYPKINVLQIPTENGRLTAHKLESYPTRDIHRPVPESKLLEQGGLDLYIPGLQGIRHCHRETDPGFCVVCRRVRREDDLQGFGWVVFQHHR